MQDPNHKTGTEHIYDYVNLFIQRNDQMFIKGEF